MPCHLSFEPPRIGAGSTLNIAPPAGQSPHVNAITGYVKIVASPAAHPHKRVATGTDHVTR